MIGVNAKVHRFRNILRLAFQDYANEWQISGCFVLALAAVLGPMMILFGLKYGIVANMIDDLIEDPRNREIRPVGSGRYDKIWLDNLRRHPDVDFLVPRTRNIAATIQLKSNKAPRILAVELIPTAAGDPLFERTIDAPLTPTQLVLSAAAAEKLQIEPGDQVDGSLARRFQGRRERVHLQLAVPAIAPPGAFARAGAFVSLELAEAIEDFRDGHAVPAFDWDGDAGPSSERTYSGFRLYTRSIYDVAAIRDLLTRQGLEVRTRAADIEIVQTLDRGLSTVFWIIATTGLFGFSFSLGASLWANVDRKRRDLSVLRLVGFRTGDIVWFPVLQSIFTAILGWLLASLIYQGVALSINRLLAKQIIADDSICLLLPRHFLIAFALTVGSAVLAAILAGYRSARIEPSDGLREL